MDKAADHKEKALAWLTTLEQSVSEWQTQPNALTPNCRWTVQRVSDEFGFEPINDTTLHNITCAINDTVRAMRQTPDAITEDDADALKELVRLRNNLHISLTIHHN